MKKTIAVALALLVLLAALSGCAEKKTVDTADIGTTAEQAAEATAEPAEGGSTTASGAESLGGLGAAFDEAFQNVEWQPGEAN